MPYVSNNGVRIHYHVEGEGPPVVLQHGFMGGLEDYGSPRCLGRLRHDVVAVRGLSEV